MCLIILNLLWNGTLLQFHMEVGLTYILQYLSRQRVLFETVYLSYDYHQQTNHISCLSISPLQHHHPETKQHTLSSDKKETLNKKKATFHLKKTINKNAVQINFFTFMNQTIIQRRRCISPTIIMNTLMTKKQIHII